MSYTTISDFGTDINSNDSPLITCAVSSLDSGFNETLGSRGLAGPNNSQCQVFMGSYCGEKWDGVCEYMSKDTSQWLPNTLGPQGTPLSSFLGGNGTMTKGQMLIRNAMAERFLRSMSSNCSRDYEPFNPTVANSPLISRWTANDDNGVCIPIYAVDPVRIDNDPIMNKVLDQPWIALDILINIYNNAVRSGEIVGLTGTKLYRFFQNPEFQKIVKERMFK
jgi:hypothetical protein